MNLAVLDFLSKIIKEPGPYQPLLAIIKGFRNGAVYGAKIRAPHALVMTLLFKNGSVQSKLRAILEATFQHSRNLAFFVTIYKTITTGLRYLAGGKEESHAFVAAFVGGYMIFGENNRINQQIVLYLFSRILLGLSKVAVSRGYVHQPKNDPFPWFAAIVWGTVLWLFEHERHSLQDSLTSSMVYLYDDSEKWTSFWNFLWHNK